MFTYTLEPRTNRQIVAASAPINAKSQHELDFAAAPESHVQRIRQAVTDGDTHQVSALINPALSYLRSTISKRYLWKWRYQMSSTQRGDILNDIMGNICIALLSTDARHKFWGVCFWSAFDRHIEYVAHVQNNRQKICTMTDISDIEFDNNDHFQDLKPTPHVYAEIEDALRTLEPRERAVFMAVNYVGLTQQEIADKLKVSKRTIQDIILKANTKIAEWRSGCNSTKPISLSNQTSQKRSRSIVTEALARELNQALDRARK